MAQGYLAANRQHSAYSVQCDKRASVVVHRLAECAAVGSRLRTSQWLQERRNSGVLWQYGADLTPLMSRQSWTAKACGLSVTRSSGACDEYLSQRSSFTDLQDSSVCVLTKPWKLERKRAFDHLMVFRQHFKHSMPQFLGGLLVEFHKYDRAIQAPLARLNRKLHMLLHE